MTSRYLFETYLPKTTGTERYVFTTYFPEYGAPLPINILSVSISESGITATFRDDSPMRVSVEEYNKINTRIK